MPASACFSLERMTVPEIRGEFEEFFLEAWGVRPFNWQVDLAEEVVAEGGWPDVIDLPTGAGKTSVLDIAVFTLAHHPARMQRRIAFVVDRRTIVDQTARRAFDLADRLSSAERAGRDTALGRVARSLAALSGTGVPLDTGRLRGGAAAPPIGPSEWLRWPDQPAVIVSTVDQFGSRMLFRGYGVSPGMRSVHAGLTGMDTLVLLDEVHLSTALVDTLDAVQAAQATHPSLPGARPLRVVQMSATPVGEPQQRFPASRSLIESDPALAPRILARKNCQLVPRIGKPKQPAEQAWAAAAPQLVDRLGLTDGVVGIVVNRVATAVAVSAALQAHGLETTLVTGRMRPYERATVDATAAHWADPAREEAPGVKVVVATQCIEVGADYSFDALITEICPLSSLKQRLGRLDRRGERAASGRPSSALVVATVAQPDPDPIYGDALSATWVALETRFAVSVFDGGPLSNDLAHLGPDVDVPPTRAAVLMPSDLEDLADTSAGPSLSEKVDALLHGFREPNADVSLVWRFDVAPPAPEPGSEQIEPTECILTALPAFPPEKLDVPVVAVRRWLAGVQASPVADVDAPADSSTDASSGRRAWRMDEGRAVSVGATELHPGDVLYVPCSYGGLRGGAWDPTATTDVPDVGDEVARELNWVALRPRDDSPWRVPDLDEESAPGTRAAFAAEAARMTATTASATATVSTQDIVLYGDRWAVVRPGIRALDGRDDTNSHLGVRVSLRDHLRGVGRTARLLAERCGLPEALASDLELAGHLHDLGKADDRFQLSIVGDPVKLALEPELMAKSGHHRPHRRTGDPETDYPLGTRHEFLSVALAESNLSTLADAHDPDLVLHLVLSHHGQGRPWPVIVPDPSPRLAYVTHEGFALEASTRLADDFGAVACQRFERLVARYGHHGLAWLEAVFRLADHRRSEVEAAPEEVEA